MADSHGRHLKKVKMVISQQSDTVTVRNFFIPIYASLAAMIGGNEMQKLSHDRFLALALSYYLKPTDSIIFKQRYKSSPVNFTQYDIMPHNMEIVT